jgi:UDP-N-acetylglucosamine 2-epimerase (non-hydrolysing)
MARVAGGSGLDCPPVSGPRRVLAVVGTRPNFMKTAPVLAELRRRPGAFEAVLVHTGQHYDEAMSDIFLAELGVGPPDHLLGVGSGTHAQQTARVMERLEPVLLQEQPDLVLVPGDVNSTLAAALVATKLGLAVGHIEAGLRSFDRTMPEEINRILTDQISDLLFTHSPEALDHLEAEGIASERVFAVGNTMIDSLVAMQGRFDARAPAAHGVEPGSYLMVTLHRPALVDGPALAEAVAALQAVAAQMPVLFPCHPRTRGAIERQGLLEGGPAGLQLLSPLGYVEFMSLIAGAAGVLTDSGGIQEETTFLGVPCFTLRDNTERPVTVSVGTNTLLGLAPERIAEVPALLPDRHGAGAVPDGWDGRAAERLVDVLEGPLPEPVSAARPAPGSAAR